MERISVLGIDLAKSVFQLHGVDAKGQQILGQKVKRKDLLSKIAQLRPQMVAMEACAGAHHWSREILKLGFDVKIFDPRAVKPFVKQGQKNDANDAQAIALVAQLPHLKHLPVKSTWQQDVQSLHRSRALFIRFRTAIINETRGLLTEYGIVFPQTTSAFQKNMLELLSSVSCGLNEIFLRLVQGLWREFRFLCDEIKKIDELIDQSNKGDEVVGRLLKVPGVGRLGASALRAKYAQGQQFSKGRQMSAHLGLTPRQHSSGGKQQLGKITKRGDTYIRTLLIAGARAVLSHIHRREDSLGKWCKNLLARRGMNKTICALANKLGRICWAIMSRGESYQTTCSQIVL